MMQSKTIPFTITLTITGKAVLPQNTRSFPIPEITYPSQYIVDTTNMAINTEEPTTFYPEKALEQMFEEIARTTFPTTIERQGYIPEKF